MSLFECVPNLSDGRDAALHETFVAAAGQGSTRVLDHSSDADHNRAVLTLAGPAEDLEGSVLALARLAVERIDLRRHSGVHPRIGALDVCPFVPLSGTSMDACAALARRVGARLAEELELPVLLYGEAAGRSERRALPEVRRGGFEGLAEALRARAPDFGPAHPHSSAGATAVGARPFLIAFNVNLATDRVAVAREIAKRIREANGGLPGVRALGLSIEEGRTAQVSMNLCAYRRTGLRAAFDAVRAAARERGVDVRESELIGLAPAEALDATIAAQVMLFDFDPERHVLEERLS